MTTFPTTPVSPARAGAPPRGKAAPAPDGTEMLRPRRSAPALLLLALAAALSLIGLRTGERAAPHADVTAMPAAFGSWVMVGSEKTAPKQLALDDATAGGLLLDSYTDRDYVDRATGRHVYMLLEYRRLGRGAFNHRPEACFPAGGYVLSGQGTTPVEYGGQPAQALTSVADYNGHLGHSHEVLLYWFGTGRRMESSFFRQQVEMALGRLQPDRNGWAFVRVISPCAPGDEAAALASEKDFVRQASPSIIQSISSPAAQ